MLSRLKACHILLDSSRVSILDTDEYESMMERRCVDSAELRRSYSYFASFQGIAIFFECIDSYLYSFEAANWGNINEAVSRNGGR